MVNHRPNALRQSRIRERRIADDPATPRQKMNQRIAGGLLEASAAIRWSGCPQGYQQIAGG